MYDTSGSNRCFATFELHETHACLYDALYIQTVVQVCVYITLQYINEYTMINLIHIARVRIENAIRFSPNSKLCLHDKMHTVVKYHHGWTICLRWRAGIFYTRWKSFPQWVNAFTCVNLPPCGYFICVRKFIAVGKPKYVNRTSDTQCKFKYTWATPWENVSSGVSD